MRTRKNTSRSNRSAPDDGPSANLAGRVRAGLLWRMLDPATRKSVARHLALDELEDLQRGFTEYRALSPRARRKVEEQLRTASGNRYSPVPLVLGILLGGVAVGLLLLHFFVVQTMPVSQRSELFQPLLLAALAPLSLYLIPRYRLRVLFQPRVDGETLATAGLCYLGLIWMLYFIGEEQTSGGFFRLRGLSFFVYALGGFVAPLLEEVVYREFIPTRVGSAPHYAGQLLGAVLFSVAHIPATPTIFLLFMIAALFLTAMRLQSGGLLYGYLVHATANVTILAVGS